MTEIHSFYVNLYDKASCDQDWGVSTDEFLKDIHIKRLTDEQQGYLEKRITTNKYFEALKSFEKNKIPGNDGLTV